VSFSSRGL